MHAPFRSRTLPVVLLALGPVACAATDEYGSGPARVDHLVSHGEYEEAVRVAAELAERRPNDQLAQATHRRASVALLLDRARTLTFLDRDEEALALIEQAREIDPESPQAEVWERKARAKLAARWHDRGLEYHADGNLEAARECYERSIEYEPTRFARNELESVRIQLAYREQLGEDYYYEGLRAFRDYWLDVARSRFGYAVKYQPEDARPERRIDQVDEVDPLDDPPLLHVEAGNDPYLQHQAAR